MTLTITLIGGPTALIEIDGFRLLTDPTFDGPGDYQLPHVKLEKLTGPAMSARDVGAIDAVPVGPRYAATASAMRAMLCTLSDSDSTPHQSPHPLFRGLEK